jgi:hypothetical protein
MNTSTTPKIGSGTRFHSVIADGNPEWEIIRSRGRGVWEAKCLGEDYAGTIRVFTTEQVKHSVGMKLAFERSVDENAKFYASLQLGQIVHYDNGFQNWIRCRVVMGSTVHNKSSHKCLQPIALCGNWQKFDLPRRRENGEADLGHSARMVINGECFEPNYGCIYESGHWRGFKDSPDPATLAPIDLSVPEMSPEKAAEAKLWRAIQEARDTLSSNSRDPKEILEAALRIIQRVCVAVHMQARYCASASAARARHGGQSAEAPARVAASRPHAI